MRKNMKPGRRYFIINLDEPYAEEIYKVLKKGQMKKNEWPEGDISFEEWKKLTWPDNTDLVGKHKKKEGILGAEPVPKSLKRRGKALIKGRGRG
jgi:hypothetical protein